MTKAIYVISSNSTQSVTERERAHRSHSPFTKVSWKVRLGSILVSRGHRGNVKIWQATSRALSSPAVQVLSLPGPPPPPLARKTRANTRRTRRLVVRHTPRGSLEKSATPQLRAPAWPPTLRHRNRPSATPAALPATVLLSPGGGFRGGAAAGLGGKMLQPIRNAPSLAAIGSRTRVAPWRKISGDGGGGSLQK